LIDEAQFFAPSWFQVVKLALAPEGQLFLCADPNQGFMKSRLSWKSVGLDVVGRTKKLHQSYRTTQAILQAATSVLTPLKADKEDFLEPHFDGMEPGVRPVLIYTASPQDAMDRLVNEVSASGQHLPLNAMLVVYGGKTAKSNLHAQLSRRLGANQVWWLNQKDQKSAPPPSTQRDYLRMAFLDTATGLEASIVFLIGMEDLFFEAEGAAAEREPLRRKLYMAMTRVGQRLVLLAAQPLPADLETLFKVSI
jgi:superfamily I DNA/RNA helicase